MNFFEYLFCRLYWWNTKIVKEKEMPVYYSIMGISVFHGFSILPVFDVLYVWIFDSYYIENIFFGLDTYLVIGVIVLAIDFLYFRNKQPILHKQFKKIPKQKKKRMDVLCIIYIASIIVVNTLFTIYFRSKNAG